MLIKSIIYNLKMVKYYFFNKKKFIKKLFKIHTKDSFLSYHMRAKKMDNLIDNSIKIKNKLEKVGIVIQGPLKLEDHFTYETLKYYKKIYKDCEIILSTWDDENKDELNLIENLGGIVILKNKKPELKGFANLNYQIVSTYNGVKEAKNRKCKYILKTRTDVRIYECGVDKFLISLLNIFPSKNKNQNKRIITIDINMPQYAISISDIFQFGTIEEIEKIWSIPLYSRNITIKEAEAELKNKTFLEEVEFMNSERYLLKNYLEKIKIEYEVSLKKYYEILKDNFIVIDASMIDMFWGKYNQNEYDNRKEYTRTITDSYINFLDWITIYHNDISATEKIYNQKKEILKKMTIEDIEGDV